MKDDILLVVLIMSTLILAANIYLSLRAKEKEDRQESGGWFVHTLFGLLFLLFLNSAQVIAPELTLYVAVVVNFIIAPLIYAERQLSRYAPAVIVLLLNFFAGEYLIEMLFAISIAHFAYYTFRAGFKRKDKVWLLLFSFLALAQLLIIGNGYFNLVLRVGIAAVYLVVTFIQIVSTRKREDGVATSRVDQKERAEVMQRIDVLMNAEKPFLKPDFSLQMLADRLQLSTRLISMSINDSLGQNFKTFLNAYRVEEAKRLLQEDKQALIKEVMYNTGFVSKATFNKVFKEHTGLSPAEFRKQG